MVTIYDLAAPAPDATKLSDPNELRQATSHWNLHGRAMIHLDEHATSVLIILLFAAGFLKRREEDAPPAGPPSPPPAT
jgi:hypothetical protein